MIIDLAFINICDELQLKVFRNWNECHFYSPTQALTTLSMENPVLHSHSNEPGVFIQF